MAFSFCHLFAFLLLLTSSLAKPTPVDPAITFQAKCINIPGTVASQCSGGFVNGDLQPLALMSLRNYNKYCGQQLTFKFGEKTVQAVVMKYIELQDDEISLTPAAWTELGIDGCDTVGHKDLLLTNVVTAPTTFT